MNVEKLLKLVEAGFTKDEIMKLTGTEKTPAFDVTKSDPEPVKETPKAEPAKEMPKAEPVEEVKPEVVKGYTDDAINAAIEKALKPFETLYNNMAKLAVNPSMDSVEPKGLDDIIDNFFKGD